MKGPVLANRIDSTNDFFTREEDRRRCARVSSRSTGTPISTLPLEVLNDIPESITILNGQVYVGDGSGRVNVVNPSNGAGTTLFATPNVGLVGLGDLNGSLLAVNDTPNSIL